MGAPSRTVVMIVMVQDCPNTSPNRGITTAIRPRSTVPQAHCDAFPGHPHIVLDLPSFATELDVEPSRCLHVEREHQVVDVTAERRRHRQEREK